MFIKVSAALVFFVLCFNIRWTDAKKYRQVCYYTNWSQYRPGIGKFVPGNIDATLCTHIIYAFAKLTGNRISKFEWNDEKMYAGVNALKQKQPGLKTLLAVGGWNAGSSVFSHMVSNSQSRQIFIRSTIQFLKKYNFDGLDMDWEYPAARGGRASDKRNFVLLVREMKAEFAPESLLLSAAVAAGKSKIDAGYDVRALAQHFDFISIMTYDLHGSWDRKTGENAPLFSRRAERGAEKYLNVAWAADYWVKKGAPKDKLVIGIATYGRSFTLTNPRMTQVGVPASVGRAGRYTRQAGFLAYYEVCIMRKNGGKYVWNTEQKVPYYTLGNQWVGYDDVRSVALKARWLVNEGFGGAMFWALDLDDFNGVCGGERYPLIKTVDRILWKNEGRTTVKPPTTQSTNSHKTSRSTSSTRTTSTRHPTTPSKGCHGRPDGLYPDPQSRHCRGFIRCVRNKLYRFQCPAGLVFDPKLTICVWPHQYHCPSY